MATDDDALTDGCVRFASMRDTSAEPTGFIFLGSGEEAFVNIQHRAFNDAGTNHRRADQDLRLQSQVASRR